MSKYLTKLKFTWIDAPDDPEVAIDGFWMFDALTHPHEQWTTISIQSDPRYYTTWGIQRLLNEWKTNILKDIPPPQNIFVPVSPPYELNLYREACRMETCYDLVAYRLALDNLIEFNSEQIGQQFLRVGYEDMERYDQVRTKYEGWRSRFDAAFE